MNWFSFFRNARWTPSDLAEWFRSAPPSEGIANVDALGWLVDNAPGSVTDRRKVPKSGRSKSRGRRPWSAVTGACLHQTAVGPGRMGSKSILRVPAHGFVDAAASIHLLWDPTTLLWHAHALNRWTVGIEIDCRAAGVEGDERTVWRSRREKAAGKQATDVLREATDDQIDAAAVLAAYYARLVAENGGAEKLAVVAHRQGHKSRATDPGSRIWGGVTRQLRAGLVTYEDETWGSGKPIPENWRTP